MRRDLADALTFVLCYLVLCLCGWANDHLWPEPAAELEALRLLHKVPAP
jgi:hypothetical protein